MHFYASGSSECEALRSPSQLNILIAVLLLIGIAVSYVPQHIRIIRRKSSEGLSPWFLLLGVCSATCALLNMIMFSTYIVGCCRHISKGECSAASLGVLQVGTQAAMSALILILAVEVELEVPPVGPAAHERHYEILLVGKMTVLFVAISVVSSVLIMTIAPIYSGTLANVWGLIGTALAFFQYFPQIYTTAHLKHAGSLSIPMMCIQTPGGFVWAASLAVRPETKWSSWLPFFSAAILQGTLLVMVVYFEYFRGGYIVDAAFDEQVANEPLLQHSSSTSGTSSRIRTVSAEQ